MKKSLISLTLIILAHFFTVQNAYCEEDFFTNSEFKDAKNQSKLAQTIKNTKKKKNFFSFFKKNKKSKEELDSRGYAGTLPDINSAFKYKQQKASTNREIDAKIPDVEELERENYKNAPTNDALFLDVIVKQDKSSNYLNDLQKTKFALNNLKRCIEENGDIQRFNGCVNHIDLLVKNLKNKYENSSESLKESYIDILQTNYYAKVLGNLMYDANYYSRYVPTAGGQYSKENIALKSKELLNRINKTLFLINNET